MHYYHTDLAALGINYFRKPQILSQAINVQYISEYTEKTIYQIIDNINLVTTSDLYTFSFSNQKRITLQAKVILTVMNLESSGLVGVHLTFPNMYHKGFSLFMGQKRYHAPDENSCLF